MDNLLTFNQSNLLDISGVSIGYDEVLPPSHQHGPFLRDDYLFQYCHRGKGIFSLNGHSFPISEGQCFFSFPNSVITEKADDEDPWGLLWIDFHSHNAKDLLESLNLSEEKPIFSASDSAMIYSYLKPLLPTQFYDDSYKLALSGRLFLIFSELIAANNDRSAWRSPANRQYVQDAVRYIEHNYTKPIKVTDISDFLGLNRSYFYSLFKKQLGMSPQEYLLRFRVKKARDLLASPRATVANVASAVGCEPRVLSRIFKQEFGITPTQYKARLRSND